MQRILTLSFLFCLALSSSMHAQYTSGVTSAIPAQEREEMRRMFQDYTRQNQTTAYLTTCGYMNEILAKAQERGLSPADTMNLAYENLEYFLKEQLRCVYENSPSLLLVLTGVPHHDTSYICRSSDVERALYIRELIYECSKSSLGSNRAGQDVRNASKQTNISLVQVNGN